MYCRLVCGVVILLHSTGCSKKVEPGFHRPPGNEVFFRTFLDSGLDLISLPMVSWVKRVLLWWRWPEAT